MPGCVLRVQGDDFVPKSFLATTNLPVYVEHTKGWLPPDSIKPYETGGFACNVSDAEFLSIQAIDAIHFLKQYGSDLEKVSTIPAVEAFILDFNYDCRLGFHREWFQRDALPAELLRLAGNLGIGIVLTLFPGMSPIFEAEKV